MIPFSLLAIAGALAFYAASVTPSLLPRFWWWHAAVSGILVAAGYLLGLVIERAGTTLMHWTGLTISARPEVETGFRRLALFVFFMWFFRSIWISYRDSRAAAHLVSMRGERAGEYWLGVLGTVAVTWGLLHIARFLWWLLHVLVHFFEHWLPMPVAWLSALLIGGGLVFFFSQRVVFAGILQFFARRAWKLNNRTASGIFQPTEPQRSGSAESQASWTRVGGQGRVFLGRGPRQSDIQAVTGRPAMEPIRVYAGMPERGETLQDCANLVVAELKRTGAFDRSTLLIATATGSGWVDEWQVQPVEYLTGGNCATASMQYSYLPSALNYARGMNTSVDAARILFDTIHQAITGLSHPPAVFVCGESLGAYASQQAFGSIENATDLGVSGALWVGTPAFTPMHRELTERRHRGTPQVAPVVDNGRFVRFANTPADLDADIFGRTLEAWDTPRFVYTQHPSDPVVWWDSWLVWECPDWLRERAGRDVSASMSYTRLVTYLQVFADLPIAGTVPAGHGHCYHEELVPIWQHLLDGYGLVVDGFSAESYSSDVAKDPGAKLLDRIAAAINANLSQSARQ